MKHPASVEGRRGIYLRPDAIQRLFSPTGVPRLLKQQQAQLLGIPESTYHRITTRGQRITDLLIADILTAAETIADRHGIDPLGFDDLFEVRPVTLPTSRRDAAA